MYDEFGYGHDAADPEYAGYGDDDLHYYGNEDTEYYNTYGARRARVRPVFLGRHARLLRVARG